MYFYVNSYLTRLLIFPCFLSAISCIFSKYFARSCFFWCSKSLPIVVNSLHKHSKLSSSLLSNKIFIQRNIMFTVNICCLNNSPINLIFPTDFTRILLSSSSSNNCNSFFFSYKNKIIKTNSKQNRPRLTGSVHSSISFIFRLRAFSSFEFFSNSIWHLVISNFLKLTYSWVSLLFLLSAGTCISASSLHIFA